MIKTKQNWISILSIILLTAIIWAQPLSGGPRVPSVLLILFGIILSVRKIFSLKDIRLRRIFIIFSLFWLPAAVSLLNSYSPEDTLELLVLLPLFVLFSIAVLHIFDHHLSPTTLVSIITAICCFWLFDASIQFIFGADLFGVERYEGERIVGPFAEHLRLGLFVSILLPLILPYLERYGWLFQAIYLLVAVTIVMLTGVRTDLLTLILAVLFYVVANKKYRVLLLTVVLVIVAGIFAGTQSDIAERKLNSISAMPATYQEWNHMSSYRLDIWIAAWAMLKENPISGVGARSFEQAYKDHSLPENMFHDDSMRVYHAHHPIISIVSETGSVGLIGLLFATFLLFRWAKQSQNSNGLANPWAQILILMLFPVQSMPVLFTLWWFPVVTFVLVCYLNSLQQGKLKSTIE